MTIVCPIKNMALPETVPTVRIHSRNGNLTVSREGFLGRFMPKLMRLVTAQDDTVTALPGVDERENLIVKNKVVIVKFNADQFLGYFRKTTAKKRREVIPVFRILGSDMADYCGDFLGVTDELPKRPTTKPRVVNDGPGGSLDPYAMRFYPRGHFTHPTDYYRA